MTFLWNRTSANFRIIQSNCFRSRFTNTCNLVANNAWTAIESIAFKFHIQSCRKRKPISGSPSQPEPCIWLMISLFFWLEVSFCHLSLGNIIQDLMDQQSTSALEDLIYFQTNSSHFLETHDLICKHRANNWQYSTSLTPNWCPRHCCVTIECLCSKTMAYLLRPWILTLEFEPMASGSFLWWQLSAHGVGIKQNHVDKPRKIWWFCIW